MMLKLNSSGEEVIKLQHLLRQKDYDLDEDGIFGKKTEAAVMSFQNECGLIADGIVGPKTWECLGNTCPTSNANYKLTDTDYERVASALGVSVAAIRAVKEVETGGRGGFIASGKPTILFEGHIFWSQLKKVGIDPHNYSYGNEDILYEKWTKKHYKGGIKEYDRLSKARQINKVAADSSASWGLFQIMGFNFKVCGCHSVQEFVDKMTESEGRQLELFANLLKGNGWDKYLRSLDWDGFARHYNGPAYAQNKYAEKLEMSYKKYL